jgi:Tfp pilus assembly protein, tip-associated adhesin PilY1
MSRKLTLPSLCLAAALLVSGTGQAEDIDIFRPNPAITSGKPNVLFIIDNGASWEANIGASKANIMVHDALHRVVTEPELVGMANIGMMIFSKSSTDGGKVLVHAELFTAAQQQEMSCRIYKNDTDADGICDSGLNIEKNNNTPHALSFNEAYLYFKGLAPRAGYQDGVYDAVDNPNGYDPAAITAGVYNSPAHANQCADNFIIFIGTGTPDSGENNTAQSVLSALGGINASDPITLDPSSYQGNWSDEFARFLKNTADVDPNLLGNQNIITYTIDVHDPNVNHTRTYNGARAYFKSIANQGGGSYFAAYDAEDVVDAITEILEQIMSVNSVFASVSLPISVNVQGTNLNQVYIGMFRPDGQELPRWMGNIKRYQYEFDDSGTPYLAGSDGAAAYNAATGFISPTAVSYWTTSSTFWSFNTDYTPSDSPDGDIVEKGAAAQRLRERTGARTIYTCTGTCSTLTSFDTANSAVTSVLSDDVINWARGQDLQDENLNSSTTDRRASIHGDVLHSRPAVVNYNRDGAQDGEDVIIFYGANDGVFRAVDGATGEELWGFVAEEHYSALNRLYDNTAAGDGEVWHPYFIDGNPSIITIDDGNDGQLGGADDKVYLYLTMRRGGRMIYAFDVSNPENPLPMWHKTSADTGYSELGQTWSTPTGAYISAMGDTPVLIFGLGYDPAEDSLPPDAGRSMGRGILVVNALTGAPLWQAGPNPTGAAVNKTVADMTYAIPSELRLVNRSGNANNYAETIYAGDTGGNLWRIDISSASTADWTVSKLAAVGGCDGEGNCRKFLYPPSVVFGEDFDYVLVGTGDREHPFDELVRNRFYMFKDTWGAGSTIVEGDMMDVTGLTSVDTATLDTKRGWYMILEEGEKLVGHAVTLGGATIFNTNLPAEPNTNDEGELISCDSNLGTAREYYVNYKQGIAVPTMNGQLYATLPGGGYPPPPVPMTIINPNTGEPWTGIGGLRPTSPGQSEYGRRVRTFWYKRTD